VGEEVAGLPEDPSVATPPSRRANAAQGPAHAGRSDAALSPEVEAEAIGAYLSRQRRLREITLDELARLTCIPLRSLERLESGAFDGSPDGFARGFVRTVAVALGLDPDDAVSRMLPEARPIPRPRTSPLPEPRPWLGVALTLLGVAALGIVLAEGRSGPPDATELQAQRVYRRDAVRELARAQGLLPPRGEAELVAPDDAAR